MEDLKTAGIRPGVDTFTEPTYTAGNRLYRALWIATGWLLFRTSPTPLHRWRVFLLNSFGAHVSYSAHVYPSSQIWSPRNLRMGALSCLGPRVRCYNAAPISLGVRAVISQDAELCAASHDIYSESFALVLGPITIGAHAWVAAKAFIGPGVVIGPNAIVGACAVVFGNVEANAVVVGNPAKLISRR